ncbi:MAG: hypothetical protein GY874_05275 [Desulfobacteraceae bacterium]|nr:hypothetical protein [Desulfobacteraceae bacterium]
MKRAIFLMNRAALIFFAFFFLTHSTIFADSSVNYFPSNHRGAVSLNKDKIDDILINTYDLDNKSSEFNKVNVKVLYHTYSLEPDYLIVFLILKDSHSILIEKIDFGYDYEVLTIEENYKIQAEDLAQDQPDSKAECPDDTVQMVYYKTCGPGHYECTKTIKELGEYSENIGYKTEVLIDKSATISSFKNWLSCKNITLIGYIGHGSSQGFEFTDEFITHAYFSELSSNYLEDKVMYLNSCNVYNNPLKDAILDTGIQRYIGSKKTIGYATVFQCWLPRITSQNQAMTPALDTCEQEVAPPGEVGILGISGTGSDYFLPAEPTP